MTSPSIPVLGAATLNRKWVFEFNTGTLGSPVYAVCGGVTDSQLKQDEANWVEDTDQAGQGFKSSTKTGATWSGDITIARKVTGADATLYDPVQEFLRLKAIGKFGPANTVQVRICEYDPNDPNGLVTPRVEAYSGFCGVGWAPAGGNMLAEDNVAITLSGQGRLIPITHPYPKVPVVPVITSATPLALGTAGGTLVSIFGAGLSGAVATTGVKFAGTNATAWVNVGDNEIVAQAPAHSAGSGPIVVTNTVGASTTGPTVVYS